LIENYLFEVVLHFFRKIEVAQDNITPGKAEDDVLPVDLSLFEESIKLSLDFLALPLTKVRDPSVMREYAGGEVAPETGNDQIIVSYFNPYAAFEINHGYWPQKLGTFSFQ
jgi:hypothetical protein